MRVNGIVCTAAALLMFVGAAYAEQGDPVAGEGKAAMCGGCHGFDGNSDEASFPSLAGQYGGYIYKQVKDFQLGLRTNNNTMAGMAAMVASDQDLRDISAYYAAQSLTPISSFEADAELVAQGEALYNNGNPKNNLYACVNCHGAKGRGRGAGTDAFPVIAAQHRDYLIKQLQEFRSGARNNDPAEMMSSVAKRMSDQEITAVAEYLAAQR